MKKSLFGIEVSNIQSIINFSAPWTASILCQCDCPNKKSQELETGEKKKEKEFTPIILDGFLVMARFQNECE